MILADALIPKGRRDHRARIARGGHHRRRRRLHAVAARLLRQPRHRGIRVDARVQRHVQVRHRVRRLVDEARLRELFPSVRVDARQPDHDAVRAQRACTGERRRCRRASRPILHRLAAGRANLAPKPASNFPFDVWYGYHFDAVLLGKFLHRKALERGVKYRSCHVTRANGTIAATSPRCDAGRRNHRRRFLRRLHRLRLAPDRQGAGHALRQFRRQPVQRRRGRHADADGRVHPIADGLDRDEARLGLEDPADQRYGNGYVYSSSFCSADRPSTSCANPWGCWNPTRRPAI